MAKKLQSASLTDAEKGSKKPKSSAKAKAGLRAGGVRKSRKQVTFTEKQLGLDPLNTVAKPVAIIKRGKKGKVFVDDAPGQLLGILAEVNDKQEGVIRSKLQRVKDLEAVREAKAKEIERKDKQKEEQLEKRKRAIKKREQLS
ncbi:60S ribosomal subunit assembly/export protein [Savitreella phatthalungensis]